MPNCFQLCRDDKPVALHTIDQEMCDHFGVPCHPKEWHYGWYDTIGYELAMGRTYDQIKECFQDDYLSKIVDWLASNFTPRSWYEQKGRTTPHPFEKEGA